jgi:hypothetical protein
MGIGTCGAVSLKRKNLPKCPRIPSGKGTIEDQNSPLSKFHMKRMKPGDFFQLHSGNIT